jgi:hypothetical protein
MWCGGGGGDLRAICHCVYTTNNNRSGEHVCGCLHSLRASPLPDNSRQQCLPQQQGGKQVSTATGRNRLTTVTVTRQQAYHSMTKATAHSCTTVDSIYPNNTDTIAKTRPQHLLQQRHNNASLCKSAPAVPPK